MCLSQDLGEEKAEKVLRLERVPLFKSNWWGGNVVRRR